MAYGSPERVADVPAYYADIRGGRPIPPERLDDLVARYRALGIEDANPLNAITEATRAALRGRARPAGLHRHEALAAADRRRRRGSARRWRRPARRPRARAPLQRALDRRLPPPGRRGGGRPRRGRLRRELARRARASSPSSPSGFAAPTPTSSSRRTRLPARILDDGDPYRDQLLETAALVAERGGRRGLVVLVPERVADGRAVARPRHPRPPRRARGPRRHARARLPGRLRLRPSGDPLGSRPRGARPRAGARRRASTRIEMPNDDPAFVAMLGGIVRRTLAVVPA